MVSTPDSKTCDQRKLESFPGFVICQTQNIVNAIAKEVVKSASQVFYDSAKNRASSVPTLMDLMINTTITGSKSFIHDGKLTDIRTDWAGMPNLSQIGGTFLSRFVFHLCYISIHSFSNSERLLIS